MADMRRRSPGPPAGMPQIQHKPGLAKETLRELAPLLAEEGIDLDNIDDVPDLDTLQRALDRAVERRNMELFSPVGATRDIALTTLRLVVQAVLDGDTALTGALLDRVQPESPDNTLATVSSCIGISLGLLDDWLSGHAADAPTDLAQHISLPPAHRRGERAATDILVLASKGKAFPTLNKLLLRHGGPQVLAGSTLALAAALDARAQRSDTPRAHLTRTLIR